MKHKTCPVWVGYLLASPIRKLIQNPDKILSKYIEKGMKTLDLGPGMGFFSIPMAKLVGSSGKVVCVDLQEKMLAKLYSRASNFGVENIIETRVAHNNSLNINDLENSMDFALAFAVVHEVDNQELFFKEVYDSLKPGGSLLFSEPGGHVSSSEFDISIGHARSVGFEVGERPLISKSISALLVKN